MYCIACYYLDPFSFLSVGRYLFSGQIGFVAACWLLWYFCKLAMPVCLCQIAFCSFGNESLERCKQRSPHLKKMDPFGAYFFISGDKIYSCCSWFFLTIVHSWNISKQTQVARETKLIFYTCMTMWLSSVFHSQCKLIPLSFYCSSH